MIEVVKKQVALFYKSSFENPFEALALKVKDKLGNTDIVQYIPLPPGAPPEIPRLIMTYPTFSLNFAKNRVDLFLKDSTTLTNLITVITTIISDDYHMGFDRVGFVQQKFLEAKMEQLINLIAEGVRPTNAKELGLRVNTPKEIKGYTCNNIESLNFVTASKLVEGAKVDTKGISIERDVNTLIEGRETRSFSKEIILDLVAALEAESDNFILLEYGN